MNKVTIASLAFLVQASSAFALVGPGGHVPKVNTMCLAYQENEAGQGQVRDCDAKAENKRRKLKVDNNGCTSDQVVMKSTHVVIPACHSFAQL